MEKKSIIEEVKKILDKHLELKGQRKTPERYAIINEIYSFKHHFDADELYSQMIKKKYRVSRATIYNTLDLLVSLELVTRHVFKDNLAKLAVVVSLESKDNSDVIRTFGKQLSMHIAASNPLALESNLIDKEIIEKEQELVAEELKNSGKPEDIAKKISLGKMNKFKEENALLTQPWVMEPKKKSSRYY